MSKTFSVLLGLLFTFAIVLSSASATLEIACDAESYNTLTEFQSDCSINTTDEVNVSVSFPANLPSVGLVAYRYENESVVESVLINDTLSVDNSTCTVNWTFINTTNETMEINTTYIFSYYTCSDDNRTLICNNLYGVNNTICEYDNVTLTYENQTFYQDTYYPQTVIQNGSDFLVYNVQTTSSDTSLRFMITVPSATQGKYSIAAVTDTDSGLLDPDWLSDYEYRQPITISVPSGESDAGQEILLELDSSNVGAGFNWSYECSNKQTRSRLSDEYGTELPFWVQNCSASGQWMDIWTVPSDTNTINTTNGTLYLYFGSPSASLSQGDGDTVFWFFDDFEDAVLNTSKWQRYSRLSGTETIDNGRLRLWGNVGTSWSGTVASVRSMVNGNLSYWDDKNISVYWHSEARNTGSTQHEHEEIRVKDSNVFGSSSNEIAVFNHYNWYYTASANFPASGFTWGGAGQPNSANYKLLPYVTGGIVERYGFMKILDINGTYWNTTSNWKLDYTDDWNGTYICTTPAMPPVVPCTPNTEYHVTPFDIDRIWLWANNYLSYTGDFEYWVDDFFITHYTFPEPTYDIGAEETAGYPAEFNKFAGGEEETTLAGNETTTFTVAPEVTYEESTINLTGIEASPYPLNPTVYVGDTLIWNYTGNYTTSTVVAFDVEIINDWLVDHPSGDVPVTTYMDNEGSMLMTDLYVKGTTEEPIVYCDSTEYYDPVDEICRIGTVDISSEKDKNYYGFNIVGSISNWYTDDPFRWERENQSLSVNMSVTFHVPEHTLRIDETNARNIYIDFGAISDYTSYNIWNSITNRRDLYIDITGDGVNDYYIVGIPEPREVLKDAVAYLDWTYNDTSRTLLINDVTMSPHSFYIDFSAGVPEGAILAGIFIIALAFVFALANAVLKEIK